MIPEEQLTKEEIEYLRKMIEEDRVQKEDEANMIGGEIHLMKPMHEWVVGVLVMGVGAVLFYQGTPQMAIPQMAISIAIILAGGLTVTHSVVMTT